MRKQSPCKYCGEYEEICDCILDEGIKGVYDKWGNLTKKQYRKLKKAKTTEYLENVKGE